MSYHLANPFNRETFCLSGSLVWEPHVRVWFRLLVLSPSWSHCCSLFSKSSFHLFIYSCILKGFTFWRLGFWFHKQQNLNLSSNPSVIQREYLQRLVLPLGGAPWALLLSQGFGQIHGHSFWNGVGRNYGIEKELTLLSSFVCVSFFSLSHIWMHIPHKSTNERRNHT